MSIRLEHVSYAYEDNSSKKNYALKDVNLEIKKEEFIAVIGHTGSGKSTLIQHLNGLTNQRLEQYISMMKIYIQKDTHYENYVEKSVYVFSIQNISYLRQRF